mgnify:CR=1 FL=1
MTGNQSNHQNFVSINPTNPRTNPWNFHEKILRIGGAGKWGFFEAAILNFLSRQFWNFFCFISVKNPALSYEVSFSSALWMVSSESWKRLHSNSFAHDCTYVFIVAKRKPSTSLFLVYVFFFVLLNRLYRLGGAAHLLHGTFSKVYVSIYPTRLHIQGRLCTIY